MSIAFMSELNDIKMFKNFKVFFWGPATISRPLGIVSLLTLSGLTACPEK